MILRARTHGPSGRSASLYQTSPRLLAPNTSLPISRYFRRYSFQQQEQLLSVTAFPPSASSRRKGESARFSLPASISSCSSRGLRGGVSFFHPQTSFPEASRSSGVSTPANRPPAFRQVNPS